MLDIVNILNQIDNFMYFPILIINIEGFNAGYS